MRFAPCATTGKTLVEHSEECKALRTEMHDGQETVATTAGFAMRAHFRRGAIASEIEALRKRVETLEKAK
jgi:hypothetical protein